MPATTELPPVKFPFANKAFYFQLVISSKPDWGNLPIEKPENILNESWVNNLKLLATQYFGAGAINEITPGNVSLRPYYVQSRAAPNIRAIFQYMFGQVTANLGELDKKVLVQCFGPELTTFLLQQPDTGAMHTVLEDQTQNCLTIFGYRPPEGLNWYEPPKKKRATPSR